MEEHDDESDYVSTLALTVDDSKLAKSVARQRLAWWDADYPLAPLRDSALIGRAVGLPVVEIQRVTGAARQTVYRALKDDAVRQPPEAQAAIELLILLAAEGGPATVERLAEKARLSAESVSRAARVLAADQQCAIRRSAYAVELEATKATFTMLRGYLDDLHLRSPDAFAVYVAVPAGASSSSIASAAGKLVEPEETVALAQSIAPSSMSSPEQAFLVYAATSRRAIEIMRELWPKVTQEAGLEPLEPVITSIAPPSGRDREPRPSEVLDAFLENIAAAGAATKVVKQVRDKYLGDATEKELASRCVTVAAIALRRAVGNENVPRPITNGEDAFAEWQPASTVTVRLAAEPVKRAAVSALDIAIERLGPFPGGRVGSLRAPGDSPRVVEEVEPTREDLIAMAGHAGEAVGKAALIRVLDPADAMRQVAFTSN